MAASRCGAAASAAISAASRCGREIILHQADRAAGLFQHARIGELVLIERVRQRHQDRRPADRGKFGDGRGAGARHDKVACRHARRQIGEKRRDLGRDGDLGIGLADTRQILLARLLHDREARAQARIEAADRGRHDIGHDAGALAAAENQQPQRIAVRRIRRRRGGNDRRPHRIAGQRRLGGRRRSAAEHVGKRGGDRGHARRQEPVGPPDHRVGVMNQARHAAPGRRQHRRNGRIAAEADDGGGLEPADQGAGLDQAEAEHAIRFCVKAIGLRAAQRRARHDVDGVVGERAAVARGAPIGGEMNGDAALGQRRRQRFGRKQMAARTAGRDQHRRAGQAAGITPASRRVRSRREVARAAARA